MNDGNINFMGKEFHFTKNGKDYTLDPFDKIGFYVASSFHSNGNAVGIT